MVESHQPPFIRTCGNWAHNGQKVPTVSSPQKIFWAGNKMSEKFAVICCDQIPQLPGQERFWVGIEISGKSCVGGGTKFLTQKIKKYKAQQILF